jgi:hypothetical protein
MRKLCCWVGKQTEELQHHNYYRSTNVQSSNVDAGFSIVTFNQLAQQLHSEHGLGGTSYCNFKNTVIITGCLAEMLYLVH